MSRPRGEITDHTRQVERSGLFTQVLKCGQSPLKNSPEWELTFPARLLLHTASVNTAMWWRKWRQWENKDHFDSSVAVVHVRRPQCTIGGGMESSKEDLLVWNNRLDVSKLRAVLGLCRLSPTRQLFSSISSHLSCHCCGRWSVWWKY